MNAYIMNTLVFALSAMFVFNFVVVFLFKSGIVLATRDDNCELKREQNLKGIITMLLFSFSIMGFLFSYTYVVFQGHSPSLLQVFCVNMIMLLIMVLYDSLVIDLLVIGLWRPRFLNLPDEMDMKSMIKHVVKTFTLGWVFIIPLALLPSFLYYIMIV